MRARALLLSLLGLSLLAPAAGAGDGSPKATVRAAIAALGGRAQIESLKTLLCDSRYVLHAQGRRAEGRLVEFIRFPDAIRREVRMGPVTFVSGTDGRLAWEVREGATAPADGGRFLVPLRLWHLGRLLLDVDDGKVRAERVPGAPEGRARLLLTREGGEMIQLDLDEETFLVRRYEGQSHRRGGKGTVAVEIDGWGEQGGVLLPHGFRVFYDGALAEEIDLQLVRVNGPLNDAFFNAPWALVGPKPQEL